MKKIMRGLLMIGILFAGFAGNSMNGFCGCCMQFLDPYHKNKTLVQKIATIPVGLGVLTKIQYSLKYCPIKLVAISYLSGLISGATIVPLYPMMHVGNHFGIFDNAYGTTSFSAGAATGLAGVCYAIQALRK